MTSVRVTRLNMTSFNISVSLLYTGGGEISHFMVSFRKWNGTKWGDEVLVSVNQSCADQQLSWHGIVTSKKLGEPSEFQVVVVNDEQNSSRAVVIQETLGESDYCYYNTCICTYIRMYVHTCNVCIV